MSLDSEIKNRYTAESQGCSTLSCGSNVAYLDLKPGDYILDLGSGKGLETLEAAIAVGPTGLAVGLDLTEAMVTAAEANALENNVSNIAFILGDIENLPFPDASFHGVTSNCVINHAKDKVQVYKEVFRVLKVGGRFVVSDAVTKKPLPPEVKSDPRAWADCFGGAITEEEYLESIRQGGFKEIDILRRREYLKNGYEFISLSIRAFKSR